jgi:hypothetical protein
MVGKMTGGGSRVRLSDSERKFPCGHRRKRRSEKTCQHCKKRDRARDVAIYVRTHLNKPFPCGHTTDRKNVSIFMGKYLRRDGTIARGLTRRCLWCVKLRSAGIVRGGYQSINGKLPSDSPNLDRCPVCEFIEPHICIKNSGRADDRVVHPLFDNEYI